MTLQELLDLKIIQDNVHILVKDQQVEGEDSYKEHFHINRILGRTVVKEDFIKAGVKEEYFSYKVQSIWGDRNPFKMGIVIEK